MRCVSLNVHVYVHRIHRSTGLDSCLLVLRRPAPVPGENYVQVSLPRSGRHTSCWSSLPKDSGKVLIPKSVGEEQETNDNISKRQKTTTWNKDSTPERAPTEAWRRSAHRHRHTALPRVLSNTSAITWLCRAPGTRRVRITGGIRPVVTNKHKIG